MPLRAMPLERVRRLMQDALQALGADPALAKIADDTWLVGKNSAAVVVRILPHDDPEKAPHLQLASPIMRAPKGDAKLRERLLEMNYQMAGMAAFCITPGNEVHLLSSRLTDGITPTEIAQVVSQVTHFSDLYDDLLLDEFGRDLALHMDQKRKHPAPEHAGPGAPAAARPATLTRLTPEEAARAKRAKGA